jgi:PAS domain S-box-containing protein
MNVASKLRKKPRMRATAIAHQAMLPMVSESPDQGRDEVQTTEDLHRILREAFQDDPATRPNLLDVLDEGIAITRKGRFVYANRKMINMLGCCSLDELLSGKIAKAIHPDDLETCGAFQARVLSSERVHPALTFRLLDKHGTPKWILASCRKIEWQGAPAILHLFCDVTDLKNTEEALRQSEKRHRDIFENAPIAIFQSSLDGRILKVNAAGAKMAGHASPDNFMAAAENIGQDFYVNPAERREIVDTVVARHGWSQFQTQLSFKGKGPIWSHLTMRVVRGEDGNVCYLEGFIEDITDQRNDHESLRKSHQHLEIQVAKRSADLQQKTKRLEELGTALRVLVDQREADKKEFETILLEVRNLATLFFQQLRAIPLPPDQLGHISALESHINDIICPFVRMLSREFMALTPTEMQVANLIREGRTTKEMAELLYMSEHTVVYHRQNLRTKLELKGKHVKLRPYLQSLL